MNKFPSRIFLIICLFVLISLACKAPFLSQFQPDSGTSEDTSVSTGDDVSTSSDSEFDTPHNTDGAELTFIPGATFQMGSPTTDTLADEDEFPQHQVTVDDFRIYTYEVTNQMYGACVYAGYCLEPQILEDGPTSHYGDAVFADNPVVGVDWVMARDYCSWAGARLPTEAEWELVSRGPDSLYYPWGEEDPTCEHVNMKGCYTPPDTQPVGYYLMGNSPDEVWDMSGNVWEWVHDWYANDYYQQSPENNPIGPFEPQDPDKPLRVIRGGGLNSDPDKMRSASRKGLNPYRVFIDVGFRCVVGEGLLFPDDYDHGHDRHERVPPDSADGGDSADDPDGGAFGRWAENIIGPCPDGSGTLSLTIPTGSDLPITEVFALNGADVWDDSCDYDSVAEIATCEGPEPADYMTNPPPAFALDICISDDLDTVCSPILVTKPLDCDDEEEESDVTIILVGGCEDTSTNAAVIYLDPPDAAFSGASTDTMLLTCEALPEDGAYLCHDLPGSPGDIVTVHVHFSDGTPSLTGTVEYIDCSADFWIEHYCSTDEGGHSQPYLVLHLPPGGPTFIGAAANGVDLYCTPPAAGTTTCHGLPGDPEDMLGIVAVFDDGSTLHATYPHPPCLDLVGVVPRWDLSVICIPHADGSAEYFGIIETHLIDVDFIPGTWSLAGVSPPLSCAVEDPPVLGRWGCSFPIGAFPNMTFCVDWDGDPGHHCQTFDPLGPYLPPDCSRSDDPGDDEPGSGFCIVDSSGTCGSNPCRPSCEASGPNDYCIPCTIP